MSSPKPSIETLLGPLGDQVLIINDDDTASRLAVMFEALPNLKKPDMKGGCFASDIYGGHPTHWVVCSRYWDQPDPAENGWTAMFIPKKAFKTMKDVEEELRKSC